MQTQNDHYAILVAINCYPGLSELKGPENDAEAFKEWLLAADGGNISEQNVKTIYSSQFEAAAEPDDANPTETQFKKALNQWLRPEPERKWVNRFGKRLYLFFAGHGFTAGSISDPALFTAQAQYGDTAHIAVYRYASKIQNAGFFDEIVLIADCCQDVLKAAQVGEPTWSPPDNQRSSTVKFMQAYGAPRGRKAFETPDSGALVRGYFSSVFVEALRTAHADAQGYVTARAVDEKFSDIWGVRYKKLTGYEPPFVAPRDLNLYRRTVKSLDEPLSPPPNVDVLGAFEGVPPNSPSGDVTNAPSVSSQHHHQPDNAKFSLKEVHVVAVSIHCHESGALVRVIDTQARRIAEGVGRLELKLPIGVYRAQFSVGDESSELAFTLTRDDHERLIEHGLLQFSSPIPLPDTSTTHEYQYFPAMELGGEAVRRAYETGFPNSVGTLLVFARDSAHRLSDEWKMAEHIRGNFRLRKIDEETGRPSVVDCEAVVDHNAGFASLLVTDLSPGTYLLGVGRIQRGLHFWQEMVLTIAASWWRTEVYLDSVDDDQSGRRYDIETASVLIGPGKGSGSLYGSDSRLTEVARHAFAADRIGVDEHQLHWIRDMGMPEPMLALYTAYALALLDKPDVGSVLQICDHLKTRWTHRSADVTLLQMWCSEKQGSEIEAHTVCFRPDEVPMIARGWEIAKQLGVVDQFGLGVQQHLGPWRTVGSIWTQTLIPDGANDVSVFAAPLVDPLQTKSGVGAIDWEKLRAVRVNPMHSPLQQALRRVATDAAESQSLEELLLGFENIRIASGLDGRVISAAFNDLFPDLFADLFADLIAKNSQGFVAADSLTHDSTHVGATNFLTS